MNFKLKALVAALALSAAASAGAATTGSGGSSSVIFSAWDANSSYSLDLGSFLDTLAGAETVASVAGANATPNSTNTLAAPGAAYTGAVAADGTLFNIKLTGFNLASGSWNLVASDALTRNRLLFSEAGSFAGAFNSQVKTASSALGTYIGLGAADSTVTGKLATSADAWYAGSNSWGDGLSGSGINGTSNALGSSSDLYVAWQQSISSGNASKAAGFANLTAGGKNVYATTYTSGADTYLKIAVAADVAPVPEADTWAMMLAGLGLMGFIARRRTQA